MYLFGQAIHDNHHALDKKSRYQLSSDFIFQYFREEPEALPYLRNVSPNSLSTISTRERKAIIRERPQPNTIIDIEDPVYWSTTSKDDYNPVIDLTEDFESSSSHCRPRDDDGNIPSPSAKKQRRNKDPRV